MHPAVGVALGTISIAVGAQIIVPMVPVPMTLQTLGVCCCGLMLGSHRGAASALGYLLLVVLGAPVLAEGADAGGTEFLKLKSAGYVVGFIPGAWVAGHFGHQRSFAWGTAAGLGAHGVVLAIGVSVLATWIGLSAAISYGLTPFLFAAFVKAFAGASLYALWRAFRPDHEDE